MRRHALRGRAGRQKPGERGALGVGPRRLGLREVEQSRDDQRELHAEKGGQGRIECSTHLAPADTDRAASGSKHAQPRSDAMQASRCASAHFAVPHSHRSAALTPYEILVGLRYTRARRGSGRNGFVSFIAFASMAGIALGVAALIVVLSVMNGFQDELRTRILSVASHIEIRALDGSMANWQDVARIARQDPQVQGAAPYRASGRRCCRRATPIAER